MTGRQAFAERLKELSQAHRWSQAEVARRSGISRPAINRLFKGGRRPTPEQLGGLAVAFELEAFDLVKGTDAEEVVGDELLRPKPDQQREALEEASKAKAQLMLVQAELEEERASRHKLVDEIGAARETIAKLEEELAARKAVEIQLRGRLKEAKEFGSEWAKTSLAQAGRLNALEKSYAMLATENAATKQNLEATQNAHAILWDKFLEISRKKDQLALQAQTRPGEVLGPALATGALGFALAGLLFSSRNDRDE
jgi:transcriptional regulator with XRE-family HTH domain